MGENKYLFRGKRVEILSKLICRRLLSPKRVRNCFGFFSVLKGQNLVPAPPAIMIITIFFIRSLIDNFLVENKVETIIRIYTDIHDSVLYNYTDPIVGL